MCPASVSALLLSGVLSLLIRTALLVVMSGVMTLFHYRIHLFCELLVAILTPVSLFT
jgi:hypothetical protein